jgi:perosamine synthetase
MIPVYAPLLDGNEERYVLDCVKTNWISSAGRYIDAFEAAFARYCGAKHGVACSSGTAALHLAVAALGIGSGDEVIIPNFTIIASANMVILAGAKPVLAEVDPDTWCIDPAKIEEKITSRTKAVMPVHMYGHPCEMDQIMDMARRHGLYVIEDAAEAHGAEFRGRRVGSFGHVNAFSFYGNKILTTGEGGMVVTDDDALAERARLLRNQGFREPRFVHDTVAFNYRMTNLQAAIGLAQVETADRKVERKCEIARRYIERLGNQRGLVLPVERSWAKNVYWMFGVRVTEEFGRGRADVMAMLRHKGVDTRNFFFPISQQPVYRNGGDPRFPDVSETYPVSDELYRTGFYLPSGPGLTDAQVDEVAGKLLECMGS